MLTGEDVWQLGFVCIDTGWWRCLTNGFVCNDTDWWIKTRLCVQWHWLVKLSDNEVLFLCSAGSRGGHGGVSDGTATVQAALPLAAGWLWPAAVCPHPGSLQLPLVWRLPHRPRGLFSRQHEVQQSTGLLLEFGHMVYDWGEGGKGIISRIKAWTEH